MTEARQYVAGAMLCVGTFFFFTGTLGILRMPDVYTRLHVAAKADSLGAGLWMLGLALLSGSGVIGFKLVMLTLFLWITGPTAAHCMARVAYRAKVPLLAGTRHEVDTRVSEAEEGDGNGCG
jgi:multicomponent Na+:H+ antiporter subunit G